MTTVGHPYHRVFAMLDQHPERIDSLSRETLIALMSWNDANGTYDRDEQTGKPLSLADLREMMRQMIDYNRPAGSALLSVL